ncbi:hypothetical protein HU200_014367 [Digitaria exilis]|uniref:Uncharacterized protein n=1 Tax=Digitaria exilis TaxID=1010633 RepID=A0A835KKB6_9POAL|nr:hypothetical protein HU200_014367 [Digitaria exilis]
MMLVPVASCEHKEDCSIDKQGVGDSRIRYICQQWMKKH